MWTERRGRCARREEREESEEEEEEVEMRVDSVTINLCAIFLFKLHY